MNLNNHLPLTPDLELDRYLEAFEAVAAVGPVDLEAFFPPRNHPKYHAIVLEILRVDLEFAWSRGEQPSTADYATRFPEVLADSLAKQSLQEEETRQRLAHGLPATTCTTVQPHWRGATLPTVGDVLPPDFRIIDELGRGAFGRVYLAEEGDLAGRRVAIKVSPKLVQESQTLARLQHTNIVPIYSTHRVGTFQVVVMPYFGAATFADAMQVLHTHETRPLRAETLASVVLSKTQQHPATPTTPQPAKPLPILQAWEQRPFTAVVLELAEQLADALQHAHERGIMHRDLKPANILLTDDGRAMLVDFNLAADHNTSTAAPIGGTPRYMAPEQLQAMLDDQTPVGPTADLYALGLIMYELLIGRLPFADHTGPWRDVAQRSIAERRRPLAIQHASPAVRAILQRCLAPPPDGRYRSAAELRTDLEHHRLQRPLQYAREPWSWERMRKWVRRHPRWTSAGPVSVLAVLVVIVLGSVAFTIRERNRSLSAKEAFQQALDRRATVQPLALHPQAPPQQWREARQHVRAVLASYASDDRLVRYLPTTEQQALAETLAELLYADAEAAYRLAQHEPREQTALLGDALTHNERALQLGTHAERLLLAQRVRLLQANRLPEEAQRVLSRWEQTPESTMTAPYLRALAALSEQRYTTAIPLLRELSTQSPGSYSVWFALGTAYLQNHEYIAAADAFHAATALEPQSPWAYFQRGVALLEAKDFPRATMAFTHFNTLRPNDPQGRLNVALAWLQQGDAKTALQEVNAAEEHGAKGPRLHSLRERCYHALKEPAMAGIAHARALQADATDADGWTIRGELLLGEQPPRSTLALEAFDAALALQADHLPALRGRASALAEFLQRPKDALAVLEQLVHRNPHATADRAGLAVLQARQGQPTAARTNARRCLQESPNAMIRYQAASALALLAQSDSDRREVLDALRDVLQREAHWASTMTDDPDLIAIRQHPYFQQLLQAAGVLNRPPK